MKSVLTFVSFLFLCSCAHARPSGVFHGTTLLPSTVSEALQNVEAGSVLILGENHGLKTHQDQHMTVLQTLRNKGLKVSVGMEFFTYTDQALLQAFRRQEIPEDTFLKQIKWGQPDYKFYRDQVSFPVESMGERTWALNAPRSLTSQVAKGGIDSLSSEMKALLPPQFTLGRDSYKKRFLSLMPHLPSPEAAERYFAAQSVWDDTMAWQISEFLKTHSDQVFVIIVGEFHSQYGGGLPDRILARLPNQKVWTLSQINTSGMTEDEISETLQFSTEDGPRADYLWLEDAK